MTSLQSEVPTVWLLAAHTQWLVYLPSSTVPWWFWVPWTRSDDAGGQRRGGRHHATLLEVNCPELPPVPKWVLPEVPSAATTIQHRGDGMRESGQRRTVV